MSKIQIHDHFFKSYMSDVTYVENFLIRYLDKKTLKQIDLSTLKPKSTEFITKKLKAKSVDVLYAAKIADKTGYIFLHFEHQREPEVMLPLRLLNYKLHAMEDYLNKNKNSKDLPTVIQLLVYNGARSPYPYTLDFYDLFPESTRNLNRKIFMAPCSLVDVKQIPDEEYKKQLQHSIMEVTLKHIDAQNLKHFFEILALAPIDDNKLELCYIYVLHKRKFQDEQQIKKLLKETLKDKRGEKMMSIAEKLIMDGEIKGKVEGKVEGMIQVAKKMLYKNKSFSEIAEFTDISISELKKLKLQLEKNM